MANWYAGRGKTRGDVYLVKRNNIQNWVNRTGCLSLPAFEVEQRIRKGHRQVMFYDMISHTRFITDASHFKSGEVVDGKVAVDIEKFQVVYSQEG